VVPFYEGVIDACARAYAGAHDFKEPLVSPLYGDLRGFPPTILISGTRDVLLSDTVRAHRKLLNAGVEAELHVFEGQSHADYLQGVTDIPEAREAYGEAARFFGRHLGR
jgi:acetyl esterase/lipase